MAAFKAFANYLAAHSFAEEVSIYPAIAISGNEAGSKRLYDEQDDAKILVARIKGALVRGDERTASDLLTRLGQALDAHVAEEENERFPALHARLDQAANARVGQDFHATFARAMG